VKGEHGTTLPMTRSDSVLIDMNSLIWVSTEEFLGGARYSASATFPFAKNDLASDQVRLSLAPSELVRCETARQPMAASGHEETIQDVGGDGSFPRKQPRLPLRYSLNR
jgi:hypothetical protein